MAVWSPWNSTPLYRPSGDGSWVRNRGSSSCPGTAAAGWRSTRGERFDLVFADIWLGEFTHLEQALGLVAPGGVCLIDDLDP
ncbi:hypothetical protein [Streptomyces sp. NRRL S-646]|uniref:hypothetical protein n=1 Tax=Streptomyces sp. NRRL S-646 TaxID=1463917 RepID=UPI000AC8078F|nr:hypothetical protein [Streptomyces sp. NRRL S-646]